MIALRRRRPRHGPDLTAEYVALAADIRHLDEHTGRRLEDAVRELGIALAFIDQAGLRADYELYAAAARRTPTTHGS